MILTGQRHRAVVIHRRTELDELMDRHSTRGQVEFFLASRGRSLADVQARHDQIMQVHRTLLTGIPRDWAVAEVEREDISRFLFAPEDIIVVVGQDGLVANVAKYLVGQLVIGVNPEPERNTGTLVRHRADDALALLLAPQTATVANLTTVEATTDDGECIHGLNEIYVGHESHQSARYILGTPSGQERQSSSGLIVATGTGSTGWCASLAHDRGQTTLPKPTDALLTWFVREAWPSPATGVALTTGRLEPAQNLTLRVESDELVIFSDGIESDRLRASWGQMVTVHQAPTPVHLAL